MNERDEEKTPAPVPYIAYETSLASEREHSRRLFRLVCALIAALILTNLAWLYAWTQYDYVSDTYTQDGSGVNFICGGDGSYGADLQTAQADEEE